MFFVLSVLFSLVCWGFFFVVVKRVSEVLKYVVAQSFSSSGTAKGGSGRTKI